MRILVFVCCATLIFNGCDFFCNEDEIEKEFYENGHLKEKIYHSCGDVYHREAYFKESENQVRVEQRLKDGELHGTQIFYWENGNVKAEVEYQEGKRHGPFKMFSKDGEPQDTLMFKKGEKIEK